VFGFQFCIMQTAQDVAIPKVSLKIMATKIEYPI